MLSASGRKVACEKCIKGHRSSSCRHTDRELFEIKPKGRPQTQCDHCRELRKVRQIHVKCTCNKSPTEPGSQSSSDGQPTRHKSCCGKPTELCECTTARKRSTRPKNQIASSPIMNRISELRETAPSSSSNVTFDPSHAYANGNGPPPSNPYQNVYGTPMGLSPPQQGTEVMAPYPSFEDLDFSQPFPPFEYGNGFPASCDCGSTCSCPGCPQHHPLTANGHRDPYGVCMNPSGCLGCLDQAILALPASEANNWSLQLAVGEDLGSSGNVAGPSNASGYASRASSSSSSHSEGQASTSQSFFTPYDTGTPW